MGASAWSVITATLVVRSECASGNTYLAE